MLERKTSAIIQARMTSTRLPGKVMMDIEGKPMLWHIITRLRYCKNITDIIFAIPDAPESDILETFAKENEIMYVRGSEDDVLSRYYKAATYGNTGIVVRITSDCPLVDPQIVDDVIEQHIANDVDYTSNTLVKTYPRGLDTEVFSFDALEKAHKQAKERYQREHVTPFIYEHPHLFKLQSVEANGKLRRPELRLTVDTKEDLTLIRKIYLYLYKPEHIFFADEIVDLFSTHPELKAINADIKQKELKE